MDDQYSPYTALLYIFNLIVGTGALTLPRAFSEAGWLFSSLLLSFLALVSFMTATFVIESMATCNAIIQWKKVEKMKRVGRYLRLAVQAADSSSDDNEEEEDANDTEDSLMLPADFHVSFTSAACVTAYIENFPSEPERLFTLDLKCELSDMASNLFNKCGLTFFYICLCLYLYGDLTIYSAAIGKTLVDLSCTQKAKVNETDFCWESYNFTRRTMYQIYLCCFLLIFGPFVFFNVQKTKYLQFFTSFTRWLAFSLMIGLGVARLLDRSEDHGHPPLAVPTALPNLLGASVYSFMCHHSLPGLLAPISDKKFIFAHLAIDYTAILIFYLSLSLTAIFAFPFLYDLYTLNFPPVGTPWAIASGLFLTSFPVFTLSTSFPIIAVTLKSNIQSMLSAYELWSLHVICIPLLTVIPPVLIAMSTENVEALVGVTGSYAGVVIQYLIPASLVILSRRMTPEPLAAIDSAHRSPFASQFWPYLIILWAFVSILLVTFDNIRNWTIV